MDNDKIFAVLGYIFPILFFLPIIVNKESTYCKFHANQQFTFFLLDLAVGALCGIMGLIPVVGSIISAAVGLCMLAITICLVYGVVKGMALRLPFIGELINIF